MSDHHTSITPLSDSNYSTWKAEISAVLRSKALWRIVTGSTKQPKEEDDKLEAYLDKKDKAAGILALSLSPGQMAHIHGLEDDPVLIWSKL